MTRLLAVAVLTALAALVAPSTSLAHAAGIEYRFPLPIWVYAAAGGFAVLASAPAAAFAVRLRGDRLSRDFYPWLRRFPFRPLALAVTSFLLVVVIAGGLFGDPISFTANPAPLVIWVGFWVGLGIVSSLVGNVWDFVSPLSALARSLDRLLGRFRITPRPYPEWLGVWPAVSLLLVFSWAELLWDKADRGPTLALLVLGYLALQLLLSALFGVEVWLARGELFTVVARTFARFAPLELFVRDASGSCSALRCEETMDERVGCPSCWREADPERRGLRLRAYGAGVRREPALGSGGGAFVVALLATVVYDGFRGTRLYADFESALRPEGSAAYSASVGTLTMLLVVGSFALAFVVISAAVARLERGSIEEVAGRYAPALIPIAAVYFIAHYFLLWVTAGQLIPGAVLDPFEREWVREYSYWAAIPAGLVWALQAGFIVWGHIVGVIEAHRLSLPLHRRARAAFVTQLPLVLLMVAYTFVGLWVLGQALRGEGTELGGPAAHWPPT